MKIVNVCFSPNGETRKIADLFSESLQITTEDLTKPEARTEFNEFSGDYLILSFPVYSQNIPIPLREILPAFNFKYVVVNVTFGGYTYGNVLREVEKTLKDSVIIGFSVSVSSHTYLNNPVDTDSLAYKQLIERIQSGVVTAVAIPRRIKYYPTFLEKPLTNIAYRLKMDRSLCIECGLCESSCPTGSISSDIVLPKSCVRCAKCVNVCPTKAITGKICFITKIYFRKKKRTGVIVR